MKLYLRFAVLSLFAAASVAQAVEFRIGGHLGLQANRYLGEVGAQVSAQGLLNTAGLELRGVLGVGLSFSPTRPTWPAVTAPSLRLDAAFLKTGGDFYYGGGLGTGIVFDFNDTGSGFPDLIFTPLLLANIHGVVGKDFGGYSVEGLLRLGLSSGVSLRASIPLNP